MDKMDLMEGTEQETDPVGAGGLTPQVPLIEQVPKFI